MKRFLYSAIAALLFLSSCGERHPFMETEIAAYADSSDLVVMSLEIELPVASDEVSTSIRKDLLDVLGKDFDGMAYDEQSIYEMEISDSLDTETLVPAFGKAVFDSLNRLAKDDDDARRAGYGEDEDLDIHDFQWNCIYNMNRVLDEDRYCVFYSEMYQYLGGMHGGISGSGYITYSKADGMRVTGIIDPDAVSDIQDLLIEGMTRYFAESGEDIPADQVINYLFIEDGVIPLPKNEPFLSEDGVTLIYQQYEIAPYVIGMPSFTIPLSDIRPYLTDSARDILGL